MAQVRFRDSFVCGLSLLLVPILALRDFSLVLQFSPLHLYLEAYFITQTFRNWLLQIE